MTRTYGPRLRPNLNPGNAKWCEDHHKMECTKHRKSGAECHAAAVRGTDACQAHGGLRASVLVARGQAKISAWQAIGSGAQQMDYRTAVLGVLQMTWLRLSAYSELLRKQVAAEDKAAGAPELEEGHTSGLIGWRYGAAGKDGNIYAQSEEIRALVQLEATERDRVVKYAKTAHDMGISDRMTNLAERWGDVVATRITLMLDALDLSPEQQAKVPILVQAHLGSIDVDAMGDPMKAIEK